MRALTSLDLSVNVFDVECAASIIKAQKQQAIKRQRACASLVIDYTHVADTKDLRAILVVTTNLNRAPPGLRIESLYIWQEIAGWL